MNVPWDSISLILQISPNHLNQGFPLLTVSPAKRNPETKKALDECLFHNSDQKYCDLYGSSKGGEQAISM